MGEVIARQRSGNETAKKEPYGGVQGEGGIGSTQRRQDTGKLSEKFDVHASQIVQWKAQLPEGAGVFLTSAQKRESQGPSVKDMQAKIGQLALENDFFSRRARSYRRCER